MSIQALSLFALSALLALASCGGSGPDPYQEAVSAANTKEAQARAAGVSSPCSAATQCAVLSFQSPTPACPTLSYAPYSLASPTAAASAAAAEQNLLARQALMLAPPSNIACAAVIPPVPVLRCVANSCGT